ncbi:aldehyde dehydrogenase family protein [Rhizorhabdus dicambivorans]|uniref:Aldehyde dehydrogenase n=1 Tax=Rhizorhabdus dicambivorans TaxID=1850238 RepID=A0A2A4FT17_9SPHN|nr:aldehyde dehydrogenase family protein [Rhizorhabdus dicambivorans]ATE64730.1 aldehyde dehydrogenase [Rhizorhabdus dicambivorans]PCE41327.1 aldehyde dehydrogenase [Rhizorhabdus dicambivorans]
MNYYADYAMTINGRAVSGAAEIEVINPATGEVFATAPDCTAEQLDEAVEAARVAFRSWRKVPIAERQALVAKAGDLLIGQAEDMARLFTREQGRPVEMAKQEIIGAGKWMKQVAKQTPPVHVSEDSDRQFIETRYVPLGVVCAITPWNFPVNMVAWKLAPALVAGNTLVLKPSPFTPLCTLKMGELFRDIFPAGVFNVITGGDALGPMMTAHPGFAKISFTGSTATGRRVLESGAADLKRVTLELGGNDAAIVLSDVDLDAVAQKIFFGAFYNSAQICVATKRLYVHEDVYEGLRDRLKTIAEGTKVGDGAEQGTVLGPIQNKRQYDRVVELLEDAKSNDLTLIQGRAIPDNGGYFVPVTIVDNPPEDSRVVQEEAFGPILPMLKFRDIDDVIDRANASEYGLAGAIWSKDTDKAMEIARRMETGTVWINQNLNIRPDTPFAGHKQSGFGIEHGMEGLLEYMVPQAVHLSKG